VKAQANIPRDRSKIVIDSENQIRIWTRHFGVTQQELARAIEIVGNSAAAVRKQLAVTSASESK
jgi:citrate lyase beta subunit